MSFQPGLEGLRGVALLAVLVFHAGFSWAAGGFLGVSTFFTLSGFLITTLLLSEHRRNGQVRLSAFWSRRFRRLMPAALTCLAVVVVAGATIADPSQLASLRGDVIAALLYVANWHFIATGQSYADLFNAPSLVLQFWSLAIEEQFYLVFPLLLVGVLTIARGSRRALAIVLYGAIACSLLLTIVLYDPADTSRVYYGTGTRAAELLVGAVLAIVLLRPSTRAQLLGRVAGRVVAALGALALVVSVVCWHVVRQQDSWLYHGGLVAYAVVSATVIIGAMHAGPLRALLSWRPLRLIGLVSYGAYLYHWPIFLWLTPERTGLNPWPLFALRLAVTFGSATISYHLIEQPVRTGRVIRGRAPLFVVPAVVSVLVVALLAVTVNAGRSGNTTDLAVRSGLIAEASVTDPGPTTDATSSGQPGVGEAPGGQSASQPAPPHMVMLVGDSISWSIAGGLKNWFGAHGGTGLVANSLLACPIWRDATLRDLNEVKKLKAECTRRPDDFAKMLDQYHPELAVVISCLADVSDRQLPGETIWRAPGDPVYDSHQAAAIAETVDQLSAQGAKVAWITCPAIAPQYHAGLNMRPGPYSEAEPERIVALNATLRKVAETRPQMAIVDLNSWLEQQPKGPLDPDWRPDGVHFTSAASIATAEWLVPELFKTLR
jgi:peptidoglycan/LPS O-acetylase OafA/YrhL